MTSTQPRKRNTRDKSAPFDSIFWYMTVVISTDICLWRHSERFSLRATGYMSWRTRMFIQERNSAVCGVLPLSARRYQCVSMSLLLLSFFFCGRNKTKTQNRNIHRHMNQVCNVNPQRCRGTHIIVWFLRKRHSHVQLRHWQREVYTCSHTNVKDQHVIGSYSDSSTYIDILNVPADNVRARMN